MISFPPQLLCSVGASRRTAVVVSPSSVRHFISPCFSGKSIASKVDICIFPTPWLLFFIPSLSASALSANPVCRPLNPTLLLLSVQLQIPINNSKLRFRSLFFPAFPRHPDLYDPLHPCVGSDARNMSKVYCVY